MNDKVKWDSLSEDGTRHLLITGRQKGAAHHLSKCLQNCLLLGILIVSIIAVSNMKQMEHNGGISVTKEAADSSFIPMDTGLSDIVEKKYTSGIVTCSNNSTCSALKSESNCICIRGDVCCCPAGWICCNTPGRCCCRNY